MSRHSSSPRHDGALLVVLGGLVGLLAALYGYLAPLTGITGTLGALVVCLASAALAIDGLVLIGVTGTAGRVVWFLLGFLGAVLTLAASVFLHAWVLTGAMAVVLLGLVVALFQSVAGPDRRVAA